jgi:hypothetical protein
MSDTIRYKTPLGLLAAAALALLGAGCGQPEEAPKAESKPLPKFSVATPVVEAPRAKAPVLNDGPRISKGCTKADVNQDGQTSESEAAAKYGDKLEENRKKIKGHNLTMLQTYDANGDGKLEESELSAYREYRASLLAGKSSSGE